VKFVVREVEPAAVPARAKQAGKAQGPWAWVERAVWTDRMLEALEKGGERRRLVQLDYIRWPNKYFQDLGYFSLYDAHRALLQSSRG